MECLLIFLNNAPHTKLMANLDISEGGGGDGRLPSSDSDARIPAHAEHIPSDLNIMSGRPLPGAPAQVYVKVGFGSRTDVKIPQRTGSVDVGGCALTVEHLKCHNLQVKVVRTPTRTKRTERDGHVWHV